MQTIDFTKHKAFASIFAQMGIDGAQSPRIRMKPYTFSDRIWNNNLQEGLSMTPAECMEGDLKESPRGFYYKGAKVIAYWSEQSDQRKMNAELREAARHYHIALCRSMKYMYEQMPNERVMTIIGQAKRLYSIRRYNSKGEQESESNAYLSICSDCLEKLNWLGYSNATVEEKMRICWRFYLPDYLKR